MRIVNMANKHALTELTETSGNDLTVPCTLNTQDNKVQLTRAFADGCQLHHTDEADSRRRKLLWVEFYYPEYYKFTMNCEISKPG